MGASRAAPGAGAPLMTVLRQLVWWVRGVLGEHAYDQYLAHHHRCGHTDPPMTEREYWRARTDHQERHPEGRCC
jgi:uncharacterized short protein YbdD (DUF466 family)